MLATETVDPPRSFRIIGIAALLWNALGVLTYLMTVMISAEVLESMPEAERALYTDVPVWVTSAYAIAVFGGTLACVGLLLRKAWAIPVFAVSLAAIVVQMGHAVFMTPLLQVQGAGAALMPVLITLVAACLVWYAKQAKEKGWIE